MYLKKTITLITILLLVLWFMPDAVAQTTPGFVQDDIIKVPGDTTDSQVGQLVLTQKMTSRTFLDGLGRNIQTVAVEATPAQNDMIQPIAYDALGRQVKSYLPYVSSATGLYRPAAISSEQAAYYSNGNADKVQDDSSPFSQKVFENSPLQRLLQAGSVGANFQPGVHYSAINYTTNVSGDNVIDWATDGSYNNTYGIGTLAVVDATDADGKETKTFKDLNGNVVLKRQLANQTVNGVSETYFDTYYVYNSAGELTYIIPPKALALMVHNGSYALTQTGVINLIFSCKYDLMGRIIKKTVPGSSELYIVYDSQNRPVLMQDGNLRTSHQWNYVKYDGKGRAISQGIYTDATYLTLSDMQAHVNTIMASDEKRVSTSPYYSNTAFPTSGLEPLAYSIFDDYDLNLDGSPDYGYTTQGQGLIGEATQTTLTRGMLTISIKRTVGTGLSNIWLTSVIFYDKHGNVIQVKSNNQLNSATTLTDTKTSVPDFTGKTLQTLVIKITGSTPVINKVLSTMNYDVASGNRLVSVDQTYNSQTAVRISAYAYNEMGQLVTKQLGNTNGTTGTTYLQNVDYRYNIHGQLTTINNSTLTNDSGTLNTNGDTNDLFGMQIMYDATDANLGTVTPSYTGNISAVKWMSKASATTNTNERSYVYTYDKLNRFTGDSYAERTGGSGSFNLNVGYFDESNVSYDENGNLLSLNRKASGTQIDQLAYTYDTNNPNRLNTVTDGTGSNYTSAGFNNLTGSTTPYAYASNGNLTNDYYKGLSLTYDELNSTDKITITTATNRYITYTYDAGGSLIRKQAYDGGTLQTTTDYTDGFVYVNGTLSYLPMPEGRVLNVSGTLTPEYIIADQQGNARFSFENNGSGGITIRQENSYYASGLIIPNSPVNMPTTSNKQLYNGGSEWQNDYTNLPDYYQTFYRNYDAALSRFVSVDPEAESAESMTPYQYAGNNSITNNDPMGNKIRAVPPPCNCSTTLSSWSDGGDSGGGGGNGDFLAALDYQASWGLYGLDPQWATEKGYAKAAVSLTNNHNGTWIKDDNTGASTVTTVINSDGSSFGRMLPEVVISGGQIKYPAHWGDTNYFLASGYGTVIAGGEASQGGGSWISDALDWMGNHFYTEVSGRLTQGAIGFTSGRFAGSEIDLGKHNLATLTTGTDKGGINAYKDDGTKIYGGQLVVPVEGVPIGIGATHDANSGQNSGIFGIGAFGYERTGNSNFIGLDMTSGVNLYFLGIEGTAKIGFKW